MLIWRGYGLLVLVVAFFAYLLAEMTMQAFSSRQLGSDPLAQLVGLLVSAACVWQVGRAFNRRIPAGQPRHSLFLVPMEHWAVLLVLFGFYKYFGQGA